MTNNNNEIKLTDEEMALLNGFDRMVLNNGMFGWCISRIVIELPEYVKFLRKRDSELGRKVADIFIESLALHTILGRDTSEVAMCIAFAEKSVIDGYEEMISENQEKFDECEKLYKSIAKEFMESYGLTDYSTQFNESLSVKSKDEEEKLN